MNKFIKSTIGQYNITTTTKCNWFCPYCIIDTHNIKSYEITIEELDKHFKEINDNSIVNISGGEPGLLSENTMIYLLDKLIKKKCFIRVFTNGEWIKKYPKYIDKVNHIVYHVSYTLEPIIIEKINTKAKVDYKIVIDNNNYNNIEKFLLINPIINKIVIAKGRKGLSKRNYINLISNLKKFNTIFFKILMRDNI